ncbi:hypothetical protein [Sphingobium soli]|nr:hypothetical protein [Sphingobium soli]
MGGMIWGIASALHEVMEIDEHNGGAVNDNLAEYVLAVQADIPDVDIIVLPERDEQVNALGIKGVGKLGNVGTAAVFATAASSKSSHPQALSKRLSQLDMLRMASACQPFSDS